MSVVVVNDFTILIADGNDISRNIRTQLNFRKSITPSKQRYILLFFCACWEIVSGVANMASEQDIFFQ